jgi:transcriptional regulator with XRE-family HTH domain
MSTDGRMRPLSAELNQKLRRLRKLQQVSAQVLADRITAQGYPVQRTTIANYENDRAATLSVDYVAHAATALGTTLAALLAGPVECSVCRGAAPEGFTCNTCGGAA